MSLAIPLPTRRATRHLGRRLAALLAPGDLLILEGTLGAGKTFLTRALCRALDIPASTPITSPTFTLVHEHEGRLPIVHADLYRLGDADELIELGLGERRRDGAVLVIEWGRPYLDALGGDGLIVEIQVEPPAAGQDPRRIARLTPTGPRSTALAGALGA
ncbi:MAG: tRNA (adenosine(37)-N6)-threonylcarbamoyltransferase complex ATPase subunit type 1 TsaE [Byssovorax sp.]